MAQRQQDTESLHHQTQVAAKQLDESVLAKEEERKVLEAGLAGQKSSVAELKSCVASLREAKAASEREREEIANE